MDVGIDTLWFSLPDRKIDANADLDVKQPTVNTATGEEQGRKILWRDGLKTVEGVGAFHNEDGISVSLRPPLGSAPGDAVLTVGFSVPKVANGSNYQPADFKTFQTALDTVEKKLGSWGIHTNVARGIPCRLDSCKTIQTREPYLAYHPVLAMLRGKRMEIRDYGTSFLYFNGVQEYSVYDKIKEMIAAKQNVSGLPANSLRFEQRLKTGRKIRDRLGFNTVMDLLEGFEQVQHEYTAGMKNQIFRHSPADLEIELASDFLIRLENLKREGKRNPIAALLNCLALERLGPDAPAFELAVKDFTENRSTRCRVGNMLTAARMDALSLQRVTPSKHTLGELYRELQEKVLIN